MMKNGIMAAFIAALVCSALVKSAYALPASCLDNSKVPRYVQAPESDVDQDVDLADENSSEKDQQDELIGILKESDVSHASKVLGHGMLPKLGPDPILFRSILDRPPKI